jgi:integrase
MRYQRGWLTKKSGSWLGHFNRRFTDPSTGKILRQQPAFVIGRIADLTKAQAARKLRERVEYELNIKPDQRTTLAWYIQHRWLPMREGTWRDSTAQTNKELLKVITDRFGSTALEELDSVEMQKWLNDLAKKRSGSVVKHVRIFLRSILQEAEHADFLRRNPAKPLVVPRLRPIRKDFLTPEEIKELLLVARWQPREEALLKLMLMVGLRPSELLALRWKCFDHRQRTLTLHETVYRGKLRPYTKTTEEGADLNLITVFVPSVIVASLLKWFAASEFNKEDDFIFAAANGNFLSKENYTRRVLKPLAETAEVKKTLNFQVLRRTVATHLQGLGSPKDIAAILRHTNPSTAQEHYVQMVADSVKQAQEKLADLLLT